MKIRAAKPILDIRYFESDAPNADGASLPAFTGNLFQFPKSSAATGWRIARKLRELGFLTGTFDHLYVNFTTTLADGKIEFSPRSVHREDSWRRYIDYGLSPWKVNDLSESQREDVLALATYSVLRFLASGDSSQLSKIDRVASLVSESGSQLKILHKTKDTEAYSVSVHYCIRDLGSRSTGWIVYLDKKTNETRRGAFIELTDYEDIFFLVSDISVSKGSISLMQRSSFKAHLHSSRYRVPIIISVESLKNVDQHMHATD